MAEKIIEAQFSKTEKLNLNKLKGHEKVYPYLEAMFDDNIKSEEITFRIKRTELYELREILESYVFEYERELFSADEFKPTATITFEEFFDLYTLHVKVRDLCEEVFGH